MNKKPSSTQFYFNHLILKSRRYLKERMKMINQVIESGVYFGGIQVDRLIENMLLFIKEKGFLVTVASGHDALLFAISCLNLTKEDEVIFPVNAYPTAFPVALSNVKPVPVDVDKNGQLSEKELSKKITNKTKAIVLVHLYGLTCNIEKIKDIAKEFRITLIEDCAQAFGTHFNKKSVGTFGDISCFSFYPTKNLATLGDGGAIFTKNRNYYEYFLKAKSYGESKKNFSEFVAGHSRIPEIQAGILNLYFKRIKKDFQLRKNAYIYYIREFEKLNIKHIGLLKSHKNSDPVPHLFVIKAKDRDGLRLYLKKKNIETFIHYPYPIHVLPAFSYLNYKEGDFPIAERLSKNILSLPFHPFLKNKEIAYIVNTINNFYV